MINWILLSDFFHFAPNQFKEEKITLLVGTHCWIEINGIRMPLTTHEDREEGKYSYVVDDNATEWRISHEELKKMLE